MFEKRVCEVCGKEYIPMRLSQKTCSAACASENERRKAKERREEKRKGVERPVVTCAVCGKKFEAVSCKSRMCSPECRKVQKARNSQRAKQAAKEREKARKLAAIPVMERDEKERPKSWIRKKEPVIPGVPLTTVQIERLQGITGVSYGRLREMQGFGTLQKFCEERGIKEL